MKLIIKIDQINYGDVAVKVIPLLGNRLKSAKNAEAKLFFAMSQLPSELIAAGFDAIPMEQKNEIVSSFANEYQSLLIHNINKLAWENDIGVTISDLSVSGDMEIIAQVENIDYPCLVKRFLPMIKEKLSRMGVLSLVLRPAIERASAEQICGFLGQYVGDNMGTFMVSVINTNQQSIISALENTAQKQNVRLKIDSIVVQA